VSLLCIKKQNEGCANRWKLDSLSMSPPSGQRSNHECTDHSTASPVINDHAFEITQKRSLTLQNWRQFWFPNSVMRLFTRTGSNWGEERERKKNNKNPSSSPQPRDTLSRQCAPPTSQAAQHRRVSPTPKI
jgi:hypothetical protein